MYTILVSLLVAFRFMCCVVFVVIVSSFLLSPDEEAEYDSHRKLSYKQMKAREETRFKVCGVS